MPAAAVIPAPVAYIKVVAVKKLVVEIEVGLHGSYFCMSIAATFFVVYTIDVLHGC